MRQTTKGFTLIQLVILLLLVGFGSLAAFKLGKPYAEVKIVQGIIDKTLASVKGEPGLSANEVARRIFDQVNVQSISLDFDAIQVKIINSGEYSVHVDMVTKMPLWKKANLVFDLAADGVTK